MAMKKLIFWVILALMGAPGICQAGTEFVSAGIFVYLDQFIEQMDSKGKVTYSSWGNLGQGFLWGQHATYMKDGKFEGKAFSGSWDYDVGNGQSSGRIDILLDDVLPKASKIVSFSAEETFVYKNGSSKFTMKIAGVGGNLPPPTRKDNPSGSYDTVTFEIHETETCGSVSSFNYELVPFVDFLVHAIVSNYRCNDQSKLIIEFATSDPCGSKIALPKGTQIFSLDGVSESSNEVPGTILGSNPEQISPLGFGKKTEDGSPSSYQVRLCPFEAPVDIYFHVSPYGGLFLLDQNNRVSPFEKLKPWRTKVTGGINEEISGDVGGLYDGGRLPKGSHQFQIIVVPAGADFVKAYTQEGNAYFWNYWVDNKCRNGSIPMPTGREFFGISRLPPVPVTGPDPEQIIPFSLANYAVGGEYIRMEADFCPFAEHVDTHFGIYCPEDDPLNFYFANEEAKEEKEIFQKLSLLKLPYAAKLPKSAISGNDTYDDSQESQSTFLVGATTKLPKGSCQYIVAITPVGVRDKFYAWVLPLDINIKKACVDYWTKGTIPMRKEGVK
jgi:hypothetical protein